MAQNRNQENQENKEAGASANKKKKKGSVLTKILFILLLMLMAAAAAFALVIQHYTAVSVYEDEDEFERFASERFSSMHVLPGQSERLITVDYEEGQSVSFRFDPLENEELAVFRDQRIDELRREFEEETAGEEAVRVESGADQSMFYRKLQHALLIDTAVYDAGNGAITMAIYASRFDEKNDKMEAGKTRISTYLLDARDLHILDPFQALTADYRGQISSYIHEHLGTSFNPAALQENYEEYLADKQTNYNEFIISNGSMTVFFDEGTVEKPSAGACSVTIPASQISASVRDEITERFIDPSRPMVAITYDDGPGMEAETKILRTLKRYGVVATFFYLGNRVKEDSANVKTAADIGCEIGNHSWDHSELTSISDGAIKKQIRKTNKAIADVTGTEPLLFRPPYGSFNERVLEAADMPSILWTVDTLDWKSRDADKVFKVVKKTKKLDGKIILMHSLYDSTAEATDKIVPWLRKHGYQMVTVSELIQYKRGEAPKAGESYLSGKN